MKNRLVKVVLIMQEEINKIIEDMKTKGYFNNTFDNNIKKYDRSYDDFESISKSQFINILYEEYLSIEESYNYFQYILNNLPAFPIKQYINYQSYRQLIKKPSVENVLDRFLNKYYEKNNSKKIKLFKLNVSNMAKINIEDIVQLFINNDIFVSSRKLYHYDKNNMTFIQFTKDNFTDIINVDKNFIGLKNYANSTYVLDIIFDYVIQHHYYKLINIYGLVNILRKAKRRDEIIKRVYDDYQYIFDLKNQLK